MAWFSAAVVAADSDCLARSTSLAERSGHSMGALYEVILQSYLFLGFPRMLIAAEALDQVRPRTVDNPPLEPFSAEQVEQWYLQGLATCRRVYGDTMEPLTARIGQLAPEIAQWMIIEGYGKVLSRPGLDLASREICIVVFLLLENREQQLHSHLRGAMRVGVDRTLLIGVIEEFSEVSPDGVRTALALMERLR